MSNSIAVKKYEKLDGTTLKIIACISMFIDHFGYICFPGNIALRIIGRLAFPIYLNSAEDPVAFLKRSLWDG